MQELFPHNWVGFHPLKNTINNQVFFYCSRPQVGSYFLLQMVADSHSMKGMLYAWVLPLCFGVKSFCYSKKARESDFDHCVRLGLTTWWFQIFFIFTPIWGRFPI